MIFLLPAPSPFSVDLFLIGSNPGSTTSHNWLNSETDSPIQTALRHQIAPFLAAKHSVVVIDGGDGSLFGGAKPWGSVNYWKRSYRAYDSMTETVNGKTRILERTESEETESGGVTVGANDLKVRYVAQSFMHFGTGDDHPIAAMMDLNSYREASLHGQPQDKKWLPIALLFSDDSKIQTERYLEGTGIRPPGPVFCRTGIPRARDQGVYCFPPKDVIGHYRLIQGTPEWRLKFVKFIRTTP